ncbi:MAG TPA: hypothetical protein VFQ72_04225 [Candidatus Paceibacterota bacterium]|nr:hypothetical protein [Candidatus Paceibacterota bacterium]
MKKHLVSVLLAAFVAAFVSVPSANAQTAEHVPLVQFEVQGKKASITDFELAVPAASDKILEELEKRNLGGADFTLMKVTWSQWVLMEQRGFKLASLYEGDVRREWLTLKFGSIGAILTDNDGRPCFVAKVKNGGLEYIGLDPSVVAEAAKVFWVMVDNRKTMMGRDS